MSSLCQGQMPSLPASELATPRHAPLSGPGVFIINEDVSTWQDTSMSHASASEQATSGSFAGAMSMTNGFDSSSFGLCGGHGMPLHAQQQLQALAPGSFDLMGSFATRTGSGTAADFSNRATDPAVLAALLAGSSNYQNDAAAAAMNSMLAQQSMLAGGLAAASPPLSQGLMGLDSTQGLGAYAAAGASNHLARMWQQQQPGLQRGAVPSAAVTRDPRTGLMLHQVKPGLLAALAPMNLQEVQLYSDMQGSPRPLLQSGMSAGAINSGSMMSGSSAVSVSSAMYNLHDMVPLEVGSVAGECEVASWW